MLTSLSLKLNALFFGGSTIAPSVFAAEVKNTIEMSGFLDSFRSRQRCCAYGQRQGRPFVGL